MISSFIHEVGGTEAERRKDWRPGSDKDANQWIATVAWLKFGPTTSSQAHKALR